MKVWTQTIGQTTQIRPINTILLHCQLQYFQVLPAPTLDTPMPVVRALEPGFVK